MVEKPKPFAVQKKSKKEVVLDKVSKKKLKKAFLKIKKC